MTAFTSPRTWVTNELVTAAMLNAHLRDNTLNLYERFDTTTGHDHDGSDSAKLDWDNVWADAVHDHSSAAEGGGAGFDWDSVWADAVHTHASAAEGGTLDWDSCWVDAVHTHASAAEGGQLDWDSCWADAVHNHASAAEGGTLALTGQDFFEWHIDGNPIADGDPQETPMAIKGNVTFTECELTMLTGPGGRALIIDIHKNGVTIFSSRPQVAAGSTHGETTGFSVPTGSDDDVLTLYVDQHGLSSYGDSLTVQLWYSYALT